MNPQFTQDVSAHLRLFNVGGMCFMLRLKQIFDTGLEIVHFVSTTEMDRALCGQDLAGDSIDDRGVYGEAVKTTDKVDCKDCISVVTHCKAIKRREWI